MIRLNEALKVLELELEVKGGQAVQSDAAEELWLHNAHGALGEMLLGTAGKGDPTIYASQYSQFETWVDGSLDAYRVSFNVVSFAALILSPAAFYSALILL